MKYNTGAELLFSIKGERTKGITISNTDTNNAKEKFVFANAAEAGSLQVK